MSADASSWVEKVDTKSGKTYYYNKDTKQTQWSKPEGFVSLLGSPSPVASPLPEGWVEKLDPKTNKKYYYNPTTKETRWSAPTTPPAQPSSSSVTATKSAPAAQTSPPPPAQPPVIEKVAPAPPPAAVQEPTQEAQQPTDAPATETSTQPAAAEEEGDADERTATESDSTALQVVEPVVAEPEVDPVEEDAQRILAAAGQPFTLRNPMLRIGNDVLLKMLGGESVVPTSTRNAARRPTLHSFEAASGGHPSSSIMMVLRRLNEEFRTLQLMLRDQYEDQMESIRKKFEADTEALKSGHADSIRKKYERLEMERAITKQAEEVALEAGKVNDVTREKEMALLEQKLFGAGVKDEHSVATATQKRLLQFWKSKFRTTCAKLSETEAGMADDRRLLADLEAIEEQQHSTDGYHKSATILREKSNAARNRYEQLKQAYLAECTKRGVTPKEPRRLTDAQLAAVVPASFHIGLLSDKFEQSTAASTAVGEFADYFLTEVGIKDPKVRVATATYYAKREEAEDIVNQCEEAQRRVTELQAELNAALNTFCEVAGSLTSATASFFEEIIQLRTQLELTEEARFQAHSKKTAEQLRHATEMNQLRHKIWEATLKGEQKLEDLRRSLREKNVDLYRTEGRVAKGHVINIGDFTDAPTVDVRLHLEVLKAKLDVSDAEKQLLRHRLERTTEAQREIEAKLAYQLGE